MAEQTFRSPGFFENEVDLSARQVQVTGVPVGIIGTAERGPAFVPITVGSFDDFEVKFGTLHTERYGPYAVNEILKHKTALTYVRVLGAGANDNLTDISITETQGRVKNAGFIISGSGITNFRSGDNAEGGATKVSGSHPGSIQFLTAKHTPVSDEIAAFPIFTDNESFSKSFTHVNLVRAVIMTATGSHFYLMNSADTSLLDVNQTAQLGSFGSFEDQKYFKLVLSSSSDGALKKQEALNLKHRVFNVSLDPSDQNYISKVLNTDPHRFQTEEHLLYMDLAVENEVAPVSTDVRAVSITSGSAAIPLIGRSGGLSHPLRDLFGRFDTRYTTPRTTSYISQPFGTKEFDLFHFETISDGAFATDKYKISIANVRASTDPANPYGSFEVQVREFADNDKAVRILEQYPECSLDPKSDSYIAKKIGDLKIAFDFDQADPEERRLNVSGIYPNVSQRIRVVMNQAVVDGLVPADAIPFGFRGLPVLKTSDTLTDHSGSLKDRFGNALGVQNPKTGRLAIVADSDRALAAGRSAAHKSTGSILPPMPMRFKVTRNAVSSSPTFVGAPGSNERADASFYWGVKTTRLPREEDISSAILQSNASAAVNPLVKSLIKFQGIEKLDVLVTGSAKDDFNSNKFSLSKVAFFNSGNSLSDIFNEFTGSARDHILEAAYIRNGKPDPQTYTVDDRLISNRFTMASLLMTSSIMFNRFSSFAKFTNVFYGGFDGVNILDKDQSLFKDRALSAAAGGKAKKDISNIGLNNLLGKNQAGAGRLNNYIASFNKAVDIITDHLSARINILAIPGIREPYVTDHAIDACRDYAMALYVMDTVQYDEDSNRLYDDSTARPDVRVTAEKFDGRGIDNNYGATYFPDVSINDAINNQVVDVPASVAALGALSFSDKATKPWFAPAGFSRGNLGFVRGVETRLTSEDRDVLYDARLNPIAVFPRGGFVIFGQKTLQQAKSALDRVNVRRLMIEIKRAVSEVALRILFEPNTPATRAKFIGQATNLLTTIQAQSGIEQFNIIMDDTNNSIEDEESNRLNGKIVVVPTRAVEFIAVDFIITNSGVVFQ